MSSETNERISRIFRERTLVDKAMNQAVAEAIRLHKLHGLPLAVWRDGRVVWISADEAMAEQAAQRSAGKRTETTD